MFHNLVLGHTESTVRIAKDNCDLLARRGHDTFSVKSKIVNILGLQPYTVTITQLCRCSIKAAYVMLK